MSRKYDVLAGQNPVLIPGPPNIPDRLRYAMLLQTTDHRAPDLLSGQSSLPSARQ